MSEGDKNEPKRTPHDRFKGGTVVVYYICFLPIENKIREKVTEKKMGYKFFLQTQSN